MDDTKQINGIRTMEKESKGMKLNEYQELASRTAKDHGVFNKNLAEYGMGVSEEGGEVCGIIKKVVFHGHDLERESVAKELGDVMWYVSQTARLIGYTLQEVAEMNVAKLEKRYPMGFSTFDSIKRVDVND